MDIENNVHRGMGQVLLHIYISTATLYHLQHLLLMRKLTTVKCDLILVTKYFVSPCSAGPPARHWRVATVQHQYNHCHWPPWGQCCRSEEQNETKQSISHMMNMQQGKCTLAVRYSWSEANDNSINLASFPGAEEGEERKHLVHIVCACM